MKQRMSWVFGKKITVVLRNQRTEVVSVVGKLEESDFEKIEEAVKDAKLCDSLWREVP